MPMIFVNEPLIGDRELEYLTDCIRSGWISSAGEHLAGVLASRRQRFDVARTLAAPEVRPGTRGYAPVT